MIRLSSKYNKSATQNTEETPIQMLLARLKEQDKSRQMGEDTEAVNRQYEMLRAGNRENMNKILNNDKMGGEGSKPTTGKINQPTIPKQKMMGMKSQKDFIKKLQNNFIKKKKIEKRSVERAICLLVQNHQ